MGDLRLQNKNTCASPSTIGERDAKNGLKPCRPILWDYTVLCKTCMLLACFLFCNIALLKMGSIYSLNIVETVIEAIR